MNGWRAGCRRLLKRRVNLRVVVHLEEAQVQAAGGESAARGVRREAPPAEGTRGKRQQHARWNGECARARGNIAAETCSVRAGVVGGAFPCNLDNIICCAPAPGESYAVGAGHGNARWTGQGGRRGNCERRGETTDVRSSGSSQGVRAGRKKSSSGGQRDFTRICWDGLASVGT